MPLQPKVFSVLQYLIEHRDRVVSKEELFDNLWDGELRTESVLARTVAVARKALGQRRGERHPIQTDYGTGYRFTAQVTTEEGGQPEVLKAGTPAHAISDPFVGRAQVMEHLGSRLSQTQAGTGRLCVLVGEAGIGKTRVADELCAEARARGMSVWVGRCFEGDGAPAFWPIAQVLEQLVEHEDADVLRDALSGADAELQLLCPKLQPFLPSDGMLSQQTLEVLALELRIGLIDAIVRLLTRLANVRPRVLFIDDLHWADVASLQLLSIMAEQLADSPLLILGTFREPELSPDDPKLPLLHKVLRPRLAERITLRRLTREDTATLITNLTGQEAEPSLAGLLTERMDGNPFFIREALRLLMDDAGEITLPEDDELPLPQAAREVIRRRLSQVDAELRDVLELAAVMGREFRFHVLAEVSTLSSQSLLDVLGDAAAHSLIDEMDGRPGNYRFVHGLIRDTLYEDLNAARRMDLHKRFAEALEPRGTRLSKDRLSELAYHYYRALPDDSAAPKAVKYAGLAARACHAVFAFEEAVELFHVALSAHEQEAEPSPRKRYQLYQQLATALAFTGNGTEALEGFKTSGAIARALRDPVLFGWSAFGFGITARTFYRATAYAHEVLQEALELLPEDSDYLRALLMMELASFDMSMLTPEERRTLIADASALCTDTPDQQFRLLRAKICGYSGPDSVAERLELAGQALSLVEHLPGLGWLAFDAWRRRLPWYIELGDMVLAHRELDRCHRHVRENRVDLARWFLSIPDLGLALAEGEFEEAEQLLPKVVEHPLAQESELSHALRVAYQLQLATTLGRPELVTAIGEDPAQAENLAPTAARFGFLISLHQSGYTSSARGYLDYSLRQGFDNVLRDDGYLPRIFQLCWIAREEGITEAIAPLRERVEPYAERVAVSLLLIVLGPMHEALAYLDILEGNSESAAQHLRSALALAERMGLRPAVQRIRMELGMLGLEGDSQARKEACALLRQVEQESQQMGMRGLLGRLDTCKECAE